MRQTTHLHHWGRSMKSILMLLLLAPFSSSVFAKSNANSSECFQMYRTYMNDYGASKFIPREQMLGFIYQCLPDDYLSNPVREDNLRSHELPQNNNNSEATITVKT